MKITETVTAKIDVDWDRAVHAAIGASILIWGPLYWAYRFSAFVGEKSTENWDIEVTVNKEDS